MDNNFTEQENVVQVEVEQEVALQDNFDNNSTTKKMSKSKKIAYMGLLSALVIVLQAVCTLLGKVLTTSPTLAFVPVLIAILIFGVWEGVFLGGLFGATITVLGITGVDGFTASMIQYNPVLSIFLILIRGIVAPLVAGLVYNLIKKSIPKISIWVASALLPTLNTLVFCVGCFFYMDYFKQDFVSLILTLLTTIIATNFLIELAVQLVVTPAVIVVKRVFDKGLI